MLCVICDVMLAGEFQVESMQFFLQKLQRYLAQGTEGLLNVTDKASGY